jgi:hypothetical protein
MPRALDMRFKESKKLKVEKMAIDRELKSLRTATVVCFIGLVLLAFEFFSR